MISETVPTPPSQPAWVDELNKTVENAQKQLQAAHELELCRAKHRHILEGDNCVPDSNPNTAVSTQLAVIRAPPVFSSNVRTQIRYASDSAAIIALFALL